jgi:hypothetical protein
MSLPHFTKGPNHEFQVYFTAVWFRTSPATARISRKTTEFFIIFQRRQRNKATPHKSCEASEATAYNARQFQYTPTQHESVPHPRCSKPATKYSRKCSGTSTADWYGISDCTSKMLGSSQRHIVPNSSAWLCESFHWILKPQVLGKCPEWEGNCMGSTFLPHAGLVRGQDAPILEWSPHLPTWNGGCIRCYLLARYSQGTAPNSYRAIYFYGVLRKEYWHF